MIEKLFGHQTKRKDFAIIGLGRFGSALALALEEHGHHVLGIDETEDTVQRLADYLTQTVQLDATDEEALRTVDIASFDVVVVAIGTDFESNLLATVALKSLGVKKVICKTISRRQQEILRKVGADRVILPEYEAGCRLADELMNPGLLERFHLGPGYSIAEVVVPRMLANQSLSQLDMRKRFGLNVLLVKRGDNITTSPRAEFILLTGDVLVILGRDEKLEAFSQQTQEAEQLTEVKDP